MGYFSERYMGSKALSPLTGDSGTIPPALYRDFTSASLGADATFTRAGTAYVTDYLGQQVLLPANTPRFDGARTAWNRLGSIDFNVSGSYWVDYNGNGTVVTPGFTDPEGGSTAYRLVIPAVSNSGVRVQLSAANTFVANQYVGGSVWLRSDTPVTLRIFGTATAGGGAVNITTSTEWKRYSAVGPVTIATPLRGLHIIKVDNAGATVYAWHPQTEIAYSADQPPPSEWLDPAGDYGSGQLGRKWFTTTNGNTVDANGVVTEATGTPISGISYYPEIPRTNIYFPSDAPVTKGVTVTNATSYTIWVEGSGSLALSGAGTGTVTDGAPVTITTSGTTLTCTVTGTLTHVQVEAGKFPTSKIDTVSAAVTRAAETLDYALSGVNAGFTVVVDMEYPFDRSLYAATTSSRLFGTDDSRGTNYESRTIGTLNFSISSVTGGLQFNLGALAGATSPGRHKYAFAAENGIGQFTYMDGEAKTQLYDPTYPTITLDHTNLDTWNVGHWNGNYFTGKINSITIYDYCLSEGKLAARSSL